MCKLSICLVLLVVQSLDAVRVKRDTQVINRAVDELIQEVKTQIVSAGLDRIPVPDLDESFKKKWHFVHVSGSFKATGGWFRSLSSVQRTGDTAFTTASNTVRLEVRLGLATMEVGFDHYKARFMHIGPSGKLSAEVGHNSVDCAVTLTYDGDACVATLDHAVLDQFGGIKVHVTGLGPLNWIFSKITTWVTNHFRDKIKMKIEDHLKSSLTRALSKGNICKNIPH